MQRRQPDTFSPLPATGTRASDRVDVVIVSADEALIATLQSAASAEHVLSHAATFEAAVELLIGGHCGILIADMQLLHSDAAAALEKLHAQFPELVLLATGRRDEEGRVASLISKGSVYRFLHKPVSPARANLFIATATRRHHELAQNASPALASVRDLTASGRRMPLIAGSAGALAVLAVASFFLLRAPQQEQQQPPQPATAVSAAAPVAAAASDIESRLTDAQAAFDAGRLVAPAPENALELYRSVLAIQPDNAIALAGVTSILDALETQVAQALQRRDAPSAARAYTILQRAAPDDPRLRSLNEQLIALSRAAPRTESARPQTAPTATASANANLEQARRRIAAGQLVEPEDDSALTYLRRSREQNEDDPALRILATDVGARVLAQAQLAIDNEDLSLAQAHLNSARAIDGEFELALPELNEIAGKLETLAAAATSAAVNEQLAPAIRLREAGQLLEPAGDNAFEALQALAKRFPDTTAIRAEQQRLAFTLLDHARTALAQGNLERASLLADRAEQLVPRMSNTETLRRQIAVAREEQAAASQVVQAREIPRTREVAAAYPPDAERRGIEGWVDIEFTIATDGTPRDLTVRESQPAGAFDRSALDALSKWRFEPVMRNGKAVNQRAILRVRFALK